MKIADRAFKSFFACLKSDKVKKVRLPHYLEKEGFFSLILPTAHVTFKDGFFILPMARAFKKEHFELKFRIPSQIDSKSIKEIRIHPKHKAQFFELEFVYDREPIETDLDAEKFLGIDLGLDNLATCVTSDGSAFIVDGKKLKSYNKNLRSVGFCFKIKLNKFKGVSIMNQRGFATLEVILMIMVIGILSSIAVPRFTAVTTAANTAKIQSDLATIDTAIAIYQMQNGADPTDLDDLKEYFQGGTPPTPPTGQCFIVDEEGSSEVPSDEYSVTEVSTEGIDQVRATLGEYTAEEFNVKKSDSSGTSG